MNTELLVLWSTILLGAATVIIAIAWFATGRKNLMLTRLVGIGGGLTALLFGYGKYVLGM